MKTLWLSALARMVGGHLEGEDRQVFAVSTDTRTLFNGDGVLFIALKGERFDGHEHLQAAAEAGATAALVSHHMPARVAGWDLPQIVVPDTERALADLAATLQHERVGGKVVAITGSNGKTSVKTLVLSILERAGKTYANPGNRNNEIGLPLAVIDAPDDAHFAVYEMGAGKPGDIAYLTRIARPDVALVNNIAPAHLERMGSLLAVADTKAAIYDALPAAGTAVINADDAFAPYFAERAHGRPLVYFGLDQGADVTARDITLDAEGSQFTLVTTAGEAPVRLAMPGRHNVRNALAAAAMAGALGVPLDIIAEGLSAAQQVAGRLISHRLGNGAVLIDDSYNANPGSLAAAIDTLAAGGGEGWLVLGDMRELGDDAEAMHAEAGRRAKAAGLRRLYTLGPLSAAAANAFGEGAVQFDSHDALAAALAADLREGVRVLVKGSRGSAMDRIVTALLGAAGRQENKGDTHAA